MAQPNPQPGNGPGVDQNSSRSASPVQSGVVIQLHKNGPQDTEKPDETSDVGRTGVRSQSGTGLTLSHLGLDHGSLAAIWSGQPESLAELVGHAKAARGDEATAAGKAMVVYLVLVTGLRALLHLASWVLAHPLRLTAVLTAVAITALVA